MLAQLGRQRGQLGVLSCSPGLRQAAVWGFQMQVSRSPWWMLRAGLESALRAWAGLVMVVPAKLAAALTRSR
jgi:hypothetical protein